MIGLLTNQWKVLESNFSSISKSLPFETLVKPLGTFTLASIREGKISPLDISEDNRDYFLERRYPAFGNLVPRDVASRAAKERCDAGFGVNATGEAVYLDFAAAIIRYGKEEAHIKGEDESNQDLVNKLGTSVIKKKYGNLFQMYEKIVDQNPYKTPMMIYPSNKKLTSHVSYLKGWFFNKMLINVL